LFAIGDSNKEGAKRKKTVRWTVFADVGNEQSEATGTAVPEKSPFLSCKKSTISVLFFISYLPEIRTPEGPFEAVARIRPILITSSLLLIT